jgi:hypothetical protein
VPTIAVHGVKWWARRKCAFAHRTRADRRTVSPVAHGSRRRFAAPHHEAARKHGNLILRRREAPTRRMTAGTWSHGSRCRFAAPHHEAVRKYENLILRRCEAPSRRMTAGTWSHGSRRRFAAPHHEAVRKYENLILRRREAPSRRMAADTGALVRDGAIAPPRHEAVQSSLTAFTSPPRRAAWPGSWPCRRASGRSSRSCCACSPALADAAKSKTFPVRSP